MTNFAVDAPEPVEVGSIPPQAAYAPPQFQEPAHGVPAGYASYPSSLPQEAPTDVTVKPPLSGFDRALLLMGACSIGFGLLLNLLPLFNWQVPMFVGKGQLGQFVGLGAGLLGALCIFLGFRRSLLMAGICGGVCTAVCLSVFGLSMSLKGNPDSSMVHAGSSRGSAKLTLVNAALKDRSSPWAKKWPEWTGFSKSAYSLSPAMDWSRQISDISGISASMPGDCHEETRASKVGGRNTDLITAESTYDDMVFRFGTLRYPFEKRSDEEKFAEVRKALFKGSTDIKERKVGRYAGMEFTAPGEKVAQHGIIVSVGELVVILYTEGDKSRIPGEASKKLIGSLIVHASVSSDRSQDAKDALDPFALDLKSGPLTRSVRETPAKSSQPEFRLDKSNVEREENAQQWSRDLAAEIDKEILEGASSNFAPGYLTHSAGYERGVPVFLVSPSKMPLVGVELVFQDHAGTHAFTSIVPVYDEKRDCLVKARQGFALSGIRVNASDRIEGIQFTFAKFNENGFDTTSSYDSEWFGTKPEVEGQLVDNGNLPVYGFWVLRDEFCHAIGLVREPD